VSTKGTNGADARSFRGTFTNRARKSASHVAGMSIGPIACPAHGSPPNIAMSSRLRVISPTGTWNVCVSGRHRSMNAVISGASSLNRVNRSARGTSARSLSPSTNRATGRSSAARSLKKINLVHAITVVKKQETEINNRYKLRTSESTAVVSTATCGSSGNVSRRVDGREQPTRTSGAAGPPPHRTTPAVRSLVVQP
jgi:hypothetical protein